jgi:hypothetical protein
MSGQLHFHEFGYDKQYSGGYVRDAELVLPKESALEVIPRPRSWIEDIALYAAFVAYRSRRAVNFTFHEHEVEVSLITLDYATELDWTAGQQDSYAARLDVARGIGSLGYEDRVAIGILSLSAQLNYMMQCRES